ncbi:MAG: TIGR02147 family protein [Chitinispirillaceae bacterium]|nr:TIGR02147 family protein [Chitinispirillaceae bacterium]
MGTIFEYMDYRDYLRSLFEQRKADHPFYSYRLFSQKAGFKSPNFLKLVVDGKRNLTKESVYRVAKAFGLNKSESDYLENLVFLNQSRTLDEKNLYLSRILRYRIKCDPKLLESSEYEYYSQWYHPVICELVTAIDFREDYRKLGATVIPAITAAEAEKSVALLLKLGFIMRREGKSYSRTSASFTTGPQVRSVAVANYHKAMMRLASESIDRFSAGERDITSVTVTVSDETCRMIREKLQRVRRELLELAEADRDAQRVVQLNLQLFPLSIRLPRGEGEQ